MTEESFSNSGHYNTAVEQAKSSLSRNGRSFAWAARFLGTQVGSDAAMLYGFCRMLDDLADGDIENGLERLEAIRRGLHKNTPQTDIALADFWPTMQRCAIPADPLLHLLDGLMMDQNPVRIETEIELVRYAYHVAGSVGLLMCPVLRCASSDAEPFAIDMGIAMQLTNIARDIREDAEMGRRYLPSDWVGPLEPDDILRASSHPASQNYKAVLAGTEKLLLLADKYYESGRRGLSYLPIRAHLSIGVAGMVYRAIGVKLRKNALNWAGPRTVTSTSEKILASLTALPSLVSQGTADTVQHDKTLHTPLFGYVR